MGDFLVFVIIAGLTIFGDIEFSKIMLQSGDIEEAVIYFVFIFPIATLVIFTVISHVVKFIYDLIYYHTSFISYDKYAFRDNPKVKVDTSSLSKIVVYRCDALLNLGKAIKNSNTQLRYDYTISEYLFNIQITQYRDSNKANIYCNELESYLIECKPLLAQIPEGYLWLKSIGEISS
jgi:hypothetical protein